MSKWGGPCQGGANGRDAAIRLNKAISYRMDLSLTYIYFRFRQTPPISQTATEAGVAGLPGSRSDPRRSYSAFACDARDGAC